MTRGCLSPSSLNQSRSPGNWNLTPISRGTCPASTGSAAAGGLPASLRQRGGAQRSDGGRARGAVHLLLVLAENGPQIKALALEYLERLAASAHSPVSGRARNLLAAGRAGQGAAYRPGGTTADGNLYFAKCS